MTRRIAADLVNGRRILLHRRAAADLAWYLERLDGCASRFEAETRLLQALDDPRLSDEHFHSVRLYFDHLASKGWPS